MRVVRSWPRLPREVFKAGLDGALSTLVWWKGSLPRAGGWNEVICKVPSNPIRSMILSQGTDGCR